jgi:GNAT superfamily N-acetyltransferase
MSTPILTLTDDPPEEAERRISDELDHFNERRTGVVHSHPLAVLITTQGSSDVRGGLIGRTSLGLLFVDLVFVPDELRGHGIGARLMRDAEAEAVRRGCSQAVLFTIAFQAPDFYRRLGYREFGRTDSDNPDHARVFMKKDLETKRAGPEGLLLAEPDARHDEDGGEA